MVNRASEGAWPDFVARIKFGLLAALGIFVVTVGHIYWVQWTQSTNYRELMGQMPFTDVQTDVTVIDDRHIEASGTFMKPRDCLLFSLPTVSVEKDGQIHPASLEVSNPDVRVFRRPYSDLPQTFGPWIIESSVANPDAYMVYLTHKCGDGYQTNRFFIVSP